MPTSPYGTYVALCANVPLDPMYEHTLTFASTNAQQEYFDTLRVGTYTYQNLSYQRYHSGILRLEASMSALMNVNYLYFDNRKTGYDNNNEQKRYYAFVDDIEYINENTVQVTYTIDVMQTWFFDITSINPCFVQREHVTNDAIGANTVAEGLETGEYVDADVEGINYWESAEWDSEAGAVIPINSGYLILATQAPDGSKSYAYLNGIDSTLFLGAYGSRSAFLSALQEYCTSAGGTGNLDPILAVYMIPGPYAVALSSQVPWTGVTHTLKKVTEVGYGEFKCFDGIPGQTVGQSYDTYIPVNNKLYTYPYNYITFESPDGNSINLKLERFMNKYNITFTSYMAIFPDAEMACFPNSYESNAQTAIYDQITEQYLFKQDRLLQLKYALFTKTVPAVPVSSDQFAAWWAQNKWSMPITSTLVDGLNAGWGAIYESFEKSDDPFRAIGAGLLAGGKAAVQDLSQPSTLAQLSGRVLGYQATWANSSLTQKASNMLFHGQELQAASDLCTEVGRDLATIKGHQALPDTALTKGGGAGALHGMQNDYFKVHYVKIRPEFARKIDKFFTCFGYAINEIKVPNIYGRLNWNYVKTKGCTINGNIPATASRAICAIFDKGVTFWHNPAYIHNYNADNSIIV